ncbi:hypothetical protein SCHPADRAFT_522381 [Schizopora paradoxa]|uniref:Uncharacterized protein n=1 Tax=Schizopora paradoxa TaxID=27342 RepID=A0A0H2RFK6_9AGAM|nr:hypothetical protein SCHPADRAFT_522381 [Schizopora paradoxa]
MILDAVQRRAQTTKQTKSLSPDIRVSDPDVNSVERADKKGKGRALEPGNVLNGSLGHSGSKSVEDALSFSVDNHHSNSVIPMEEASDPVTTGNGVSPPALNTTSSNKLTTIENESGNDDTKLASKPLRIRRPLFLAQAHLSKAGTSRIGDDPGSSNAKSEVPSLLSRLAMNTDDVHEPEPHPGNAIGHSESSPVSCVVRTGQTIPPNSSQNGGVPEITAPSIRNRLRQRLEQAKAEHVASTPPVVAEVQSDEDDYDARADSEASENRLRFQARLRAKLANERRGGANTRPDFDSDHRSGTQGDVGRSTKGISSVGMDAGIQESGREVALKALLGGRRNPYDQRDQS